MKIKVLFIILTSLFFVNVGIQSCKKPKNQDTETPAPPPLNGELNLPSLPFDYAGATNSIPPYIRNYINAHPGIDNNPIDNPVTNNGATLGRVLFYDKNLSVNNQTACASCHHQDKGFVDGLQFSKGFSDGLTRRNSMPLTNLRYFPVKNMFWDMRALTLERQVLEPVTDKIEMGMPSIDVLITKLKSINYYPELFKKAFGTSEINSDRIAKAMSQFIRSIIAFNSKYDQGLNNNFSNFTASESNGFRLFKSTFCAECHSDLSNSRVDQVPTFLVADNSGINERVGSNNGLEMIYRDNGIGEKTGLVKDMATFKMPALRNVELTAPYMHDGRFSTLEQVIDHYSAGVKNHPNRGIQVVPGGFRFSDQAKKDLVAFLKTLTDKSLATDIKYSSPFK